ncbi:hypothetical protein ACPXBI_28470, partial [Escherichia coli]|uniref:hypothetical protein n=1 Tax=Escherichia coli TaxID=562 RepID=UPI003CE4ED14
LIIPRKTTSKSACAVLQNDETTFTRKRKKSKRNPVRMSSDSYHETPGEKLRYSSLDEVHLIRERLCVFCRKLSPRADMLRLTV